MQFCAFLTKVCHIQVTVKVIGLLVCSDLSVSTKSHRVLYGVFYLQVFMYTFASHDVHYKSIWLSFYHINSYFRYRYPNIFQRQVTQNDYSFKSRYRVDIFFYRSPTFSTVMISLAEYAWLLIRINCNKVCQDDF